MWRYRLLIGLSGMATLALVLGQDCAGQGFPVLGDSAVLAGESTENETEVLSSGTDVPRETSQAVAQRNGPPDGIPCPEGPPCERPQPPRPDTPPEGNGWPPGPDGPFAGPGPGEPQCGEGKPCAGPKRPCPLPPEGATPEQIVEHCVARATEIADRCILHNEDTAEMGVCRISELLEQGLEEEAIALARRCAYRIHRHTGHCVRHLIRMCHCCSKGIEAVGGDETLLEQMRLACEEQVQRVKDSRDAAIQAIEDVVGVDLEPEPPADDEVVEEESET